MIDSPIKLTIAALGGQGGGVLADWLIQVAEAESYLAQSTSVPGVAQRTGATIYYLEFFPRAAAARAGCEPVMSLTPVSGDVDCVLASELLEAGRMIERGLVTPQRTTLIASSHRAYTIAEKSAMGSAVADAAQLAELARSHARRLILFDMTQMAERHHSVISSVLLGALAGSAALPFRKESFENAIRKSGISVATNLAAFEAACRQVESGTPDPPARASAGPTITIPERARSPAVQPLLDRVRALPAVLQPLALAAVRRLIDYQDCAYAAFYLARIEHVLAHERQRPASPQNWDLTAATARCLALWMSFEDTIRVADLKIRDTRFERVRSEVQASADQIVGVTEFMKPRVAEITGTLPARLGRRVRRCAWASRLLARMTGARQVRTSTIGGFLLLYAIAGMRRWRRVTLRYREENARIEEWLARLEQIAPANHALAVEVARAQRIVKGYGDTHERATRNFGILMGQLDALVHRVDAASVFSRLIEAALADEEGRALAQAVAELHPGAVSRAVPRL